MPIVLFANGLIPANYLTTVGFLWRIASRINAESVSGRYSTYHSPVFEPDSLTLADCVFARQYRLYHSKIHKVAFRPQERRKSKSDTWSRTIPNSLLYYFFFLFNAIYINNVRSRTREIWQYLNSTLCPLRKERFEVQNVKLDMILTVSFKSKDIWQIVNMVKLKINLTVV